jgi:mercuric ion transport protein
MIKSKSKGLLLTSGIFSAIAASLCCITPVLALVAGSSSIAATFSWIEPARPFLIGVSVAALGFAWFQKLKPQNQVECDCKTEENPQFIHSKTFLGIITIFAVMMIAFPYYSKVFFPKTNKQIIIVDKSNIQTAEFTISGMSCTSCAEEIKHEINKLNGIINAEASYANSNAQVQFDNTKTNLIEIEKAINSTGYTVIKSAFKN